MSDSRQDRDFSFGYMESENKKKAPKSSKRFHRSVYEKESGQYVGEQGLFSALIFLAAGLSLLGFVIFGFFSVNVTGDVWVILATGVIFSLPCNLLGVVGLLAYFTGIGPEKGFGSDGALEEHERH